LNIEAIVVELKGERDRIDRAISALEGTFSKVARSGVKALAGKRKPWSFECGGQEMNIRDDEETLGRATEKGCCQEAVKVLRIYYDGVREGVLVASQCWLAE